MKLLELVEGYVECDCTCPARAVHLYIDPVTNLALAFCGHHSAKHGPALDDRGWRIVQIEEGK